MANNKNALVSCPSCNEMISGTAKACPKCGNARSLKDRLTGKQIVSLLAVAVGIVLMLHPAGSTGAGVVITALAVGYYLWSFKR